MKPDRQTETQSSDQLSDQREPGFYIVDNEIIDIHGGLPPINETGS
jgi:hypothetical protein